MRCVALAHAWQRTGGAVHFLSRCDSAGLRDTIREAGFGLDLLDASCPDASDLERTRAEGLKRNAQVVVIDGYCFDLPYQQALRASGFTLAMIDDLADAAEYSVDVLVNQNLHAPALEYRRPAGAVVLLGTRYVLLRPEFLEYPRWTRPPRAPGRNVLVTFGGGDSHGLTLKVARALAEPPMDRYDIRIIAGPMNPHRGELYALAERTRHVAVLSDVRDMPAQMDWADVAIAAGGSTCWELAFMGVPIIALSMAPNQMPVAEALGRMGVARYLGWHEAVSMSAVRETVNELLTDPEARRLMAARGRELVDGQGADRVVSELRRREVVLRRAVESDCRLLWDWANDPDVRAQSFISDPIAWDRHVAWFGARLLDSQCVLLIASDVEGQPVGQARFDIHGGSATISISLSAAVRGRGLGTVLISRASQELHRLTGIGVIDAFVKTDNAASARAFEKAGFTLAGRTTVHGSEAFHFRRTGT